MNREETIEKITAFFEAYDHDGLEGCAFCALGDGLHLVMAQSEDEPHARVAKIAYNCDDLQCDFDWDWRAPVGLDGEAVDTTLALGAASHAEDAMWFYDEYEAIAGEMRLGKIVCE